MSKFSEGFGDSGNQGINPKYLQDIRLKDDKVRIGNKQKEQERIRIKQLSIARDGAKKLGKKNYVWLISIGVAVLSYNFAKSNKEFYAFVGLLSPALIMISKSKYEKIVRDKKMKIERERRNSLAQA
ncbi:MAG: hypothetical protein P1U29_03840 [Candidatus Pelagibacter bacterium]|nr:hypothetical protein [Candidatus Pelagibacter bacterium]